MSRELSLYEAIGGTYTEVNGILYPNISVEAKEPNTDSAITSTNIWIKNTIHLCISTAHGFI